MSIVFSNDLFFFMKGARDLGWPLDLLRNGIKEKGLVKCWPPAAVNVGEVIKLFPRQTVLGAQINSVVPIKPTDRLIVLESNGYSIFTITSIQQDQRDVQATQPGTVGFKVDRDVTKVIEGSLVFLVSSLEGTSGEDPAGSPYSPSKASGD